MDFDVIVVGGGPAGCRSARDIAMKGYKVAVLEEHGQVGEPMQCAGLVSPGALVLANTSGNLILNSFTGVRLHSPGGNTLVIRSNKVYAHAIDRSAFDRELAEQARRAGAEIFLATRVLDFERLPGGVRVWARRGTDVQAFTGRLIIGADGARSRTARWLGLSPPPHVVYMYAAEVVLNSIDTSLIDIFLGCEVAPGWFGWVIPVSENTARVGVGVFQGKGSPAACFEKLTARYSRRFCGMEISRLTGGVVPIGLMERTYGPNAMVVGDAACHVKPISGGGVYLGLVGAGCCARAAVEALARGDFSARALSRYQEYWEEEMGAEIKCGLLYRELFLELSDSDMDFFIRFFDRPYWRSVIAKYGDIDRPSRLAQRIAPVVPWAERVLRMSFMRRNWVTCGQRI